MSTVKIKYRRPGGAFIDEVIYVKNDGQDPAGTRNSVKEILSAATPRGRIAKWKGHAERLAVGLEEILEAECLIDNRGKVSDMNLFDLLLSRAVHKIDLAQNEKTIIPIAVIGKKHSGTQSEKAKKKRIRNGVTPADREARDAAMCEHFKKTRLTINGFAVKHAAKYGLKPRSVRYILEKTVGN